jgi:hypothetical protein
MTRRVDGVITVRLAVRIAAAGLLLFVQGGGRYSIDAMLAKK